MAQAEKKQGRAARPGSILPKCADSTADKIPPCFTSRLRGVYGHDFEDMNGHVRGSDACNVCTRIRACFRVSWVNEPAKTDATLRIVIARPRQTKGGLPP